jgi:hypothetical protein
MGTILLLVAAGLFLLATFGVPSGTVHLGYLGLTFLASAMIVGAGWPFRNPPAG